MYIQGPHDDMFAVMVTLRKTVGDGNFHYLCQDRLTPPSARLRSLGPGPAEPAPRGLAQVLALAHASC